MSFKKVKSAENAKSPFSKHKSMQSSKSGKPRSFSQTKKFGRPFSEDKDSDQLIKKDGFGNMKKPHQPRFGSKSRSEGDEFPQRSQPRFGSKSRSEGDEFSPRSRPRFDSKSRPARDEFPQRSQPRFGSKTRSEGDEFPPRSRPRFDSKNRPARDEFPPRKNKSERWEKREHPTHAKQFKPMERPEKIASSFEEVVESQKTPVLFSQFKLSEALQDALDRLEFTIATPIQAKAIPVALKGHDILGSAQTGTGKTLAFALPILEKFVTSGHGSALILAPTRELAAQILKSFHDLLPRKGGIKTALLIGGEPMGKQFRDLKQRPRIIVGTPGRVIDHLARNSLDLEDAQFLVLDEADRMMDMGFEPQIQEVMQSLPEERQTFMFSATFSPHVLKLAHKYLNQPERITIGEQHQVSINIRQEALQVKPAAKFEKLIQELDKREGTVIIFVKTKRSADDLADKLTDVDHQAKAIHGDLHQRKRDSVIKGFRDQRHRILVATDVAARGLDIPHIEHVINYDLPQTPEDYMHRIGRTARAGKKGSALTLVAPSEIGKWKGIERFIQKKQGKK